MQRPRLKRDVKIEVRVTEEELELYRSVLLEGETLSKFVRMACTGRANFLVRNKKRSQRASIPRTGSPKAAKPSRNEATDDNNESLVKELVVKAKGEGKSWMEIMAILREKGHTNYSIRGIKQIHKNNGRESLG